MLNAEKFKKEIMEKAIASYNFMIDKNKHTIEQCFGNCGECSFNEFGEHCSHSKIKWLLSEYKEPIKLSRLEYEILKHVQKEGFNFITRNDYGYLHGDLFIYEIKPKKPYSDVGWCTTGECYVLYAFSDLFQFVKCEGKEPTSIKDVLDNCEVVEIE